MSFLRRIFLESALWIKAFRFCLMTVQRFALSNQSAAVSPFSFRWNFCGVIELGSFSFVLRGNRFSVLMCGGATPDSCSMLHEFLVCTLSPGRRLIGEVPSKEVPECG